MSDVDDLVAAMVKGDPDETVPLEVVTAMAEAVRDAHFVRCLHADFVSDYHVLGGLVRRTCQRCGATDQHDVQAPAADWLAWKGGTDG